MGGNLSCPAGFEEGGFLSCRSTCPPEFKHVQEGGGAAGPPVLKCVSVRRNNRFFTLTALRPADRDQPLSVEYETEVDRVKTEAARVLAEVDADIQETRLLNDASDSRSKQVRDYSKIESDYAVFTEQRKVTDEIEKTKESLKPLRPPTAPASDMEKERREITDIARRNLFFIQVALFLVVLAMLCYLILPQDSANLIAFALLSVGIAMGFFLKG